MSTQDWATREGGEGEHSSEHEGGNAVAGADVAGSQTTRMRAMQRRWIQRKASRGDGAGAGGAAAIPDGAGAQLGGDTKSRMERTIGADLSGVRVHTGGDSADAADAMGARAFTVGSDVHFNRGEFAPGSKEGDRLLAHELTHVVQGQKSGVQRKADAAHGDADGGGEHGDHEAGGHEVSEPGDASEHEADAMGDHAAENLHGGGDKGGGEQGAAAASGSAPAAGAATTKKVSRKPQINAAAPDVGRKIYRSTGGKPPTGAKPPPIPEAAKKGKSAAPAAAAGAPAATPSKDPAEQKAEDWCATNVPKLEKFDPKTSSFSILTQFESGLVDYKTKFKDNEKVKNALQLLDKKKLEVDTTGAAEVTKNVIEPVKALDAKIPGSYQAAGALRAAMQRWKSYFVDASDGPKGFAAVQLAAQSIDTFQKEVEKNRDTAIATLISQIGGVDAADPKAMEKLDATFKSGDPWLHASGLPNGPAKLQEATLAKATKQGQIDAELKLKQEKEKQEKEKQDQDKKKHDQQPGAKAAGAGAGAPAPGPAPKDQKKDAAGAGAAAPGASAAAPKTAAAPVLPAVQAQQHAADPKDAKGGHDADAADKHAGADPHAANAGASAHGPEAAKAHGPEGAHAKEHDPEEEKKKLEEEKRQNEMEQLETEIELACQQMIQKVAWGNAGLGLLASLGGIAIPGLHYAGALKSAAAAAKVITAEYDAKFLTFAIKHMQPKEIQVCLEIINDKTQSFGNLKDVITNMLGEERQAAAHADMKKAKGGKHVAGEAVKGEGPELGGEGVGVALHAGEQAIEHAGGEALGAIAGELAGILPFVSVGFGIKSAMAAGDKIMNLRMQLIALQDEAEHLGAQTGRKKI